MPSRLAAREPQVAAAGKLPVNPPKPSGNMPPFQPQFQFGDPNQAFMAFQQWNFQQWYNQMAPGGAVPAAVNQQPVPPAVVPPAAANPASVTNYPKTWKNRLAATADVLDRFVIRIQASNKL